MKAKIFLIFFLLSTAALCDEAEVIDVFRNITLSNDEVALKDFYIRIDSSHPVKKNLIVKVVRKIDVKDSAGKPVGDFKAQVGLLKIIHIDSKVAVAREHQLTPRDSQPLLEQIGIMVGDQIDFSESFIDTTIKKGNQKNASTPTVEPQRDISSAKPVENSQPSEKIEESPSAEKINPASVSPVEVQKI